MQTASEMASIFYRLSCSVTNLLRWEPFCMSLSESLLVRFGFKGLRVVSNRFGGWC